MSDDLDNLKLEFDSTVADCSRFFFAARAREFQIESIERLEALSSEACGLKQRMISAGDEDSANQLLSLEKMLWAFICELRMWVAFKDDDPHAAWTALVNAQGAARTAMQAHGSADSLQGYAERLHLLEHLLFPPQQFMSAGVVVVRSTCSVCGSEYGDCDHIKGRAYMGQMCSRLIEECRLPEISIVDSPASKHCRIISFSDGGVTRDLMTWRPVSPVPDAESGTDAEGLLQQYLAEVTRPGQTIV